MFTLSCNISFGWRNRRVHNFLFWPFPEFASPSKGYISSCWITLSPCKEVLEIQRSVASSNEFSNANLCVYGSIVFELQNIYISTSNALNIFFVPNTSFSLYLYGKEVLEIQRSVALCKIKSSDWLWRNFQMQNYAYMGLLSLRYKRYG